MRDNPGQQRFELVVDGTVAGFAAYERDGDTVRITHTEIDPAYEGKGYGARLAGQALDSLRRDGLSVVPACRFIAAYVQRHPEYQDMVAR
jgi:predicted GNAT family acetyltransferase